MSRTCTWLVVALVVGCKREPAGTTESAGSQTAQVAPVHADAALQPDAPPPLDAAAAAPTEAQALAAAKAWFAAASSKDVKQLAAASALPFHIQDLYAKCASGVLEEATDLDKLATCMGKSNLRATFGNTERKPDLEVSTTVPEPTAMIELQAKEWSSVVPADQHASHAFVVLTNGHPEYWSDMLYALVAVRLVDGTPKVDGATLLLSQEGD